MKIMKKKRKIERFFQGLLVIIHIVLTILVMSDVRKIQGNARVINYAGIIRGATQREIKLEISGNENDSLIEYLDTIFEGLMNGGGKYQLTKLENPQYQDKLLELNTSWSSLKKEIQKAREIGYENTRIIDMSEEYFYLADETVTAAENYSHYCELRLNKLEKGLMITSAVIIFVIIRESILALILMGNLK
ncbi:MAG: hypothetical protein Q4Q31_09820 [Bacillota bacterium]|nr:hypothetical protein [Bacillota bacterium]